MDNKLLSRYSPTDVVVNSFRKTIILKSGDKVSRPLPVEQVGVQGFALKANGFPASDISLLIKSSNDVQLREAFRQMSSVRGEVRSSKLTYREAIKFAKPRSIDLPHERELFAEFVMNETGHSLDDLYNSANTTTTAENEKSDISQATEQASE